jgi:hypothetical protein
VAQIRCSNEARHTQHAPQSLTIILLLSGKKKRSKIMSIPRTEPELVIWLKNFAQTFATHAPTLGFTAAEVASVQADAAMLDYLVSDSIPTYKANLDARYSYKNLIKNGPMGAPGGNPPPDPPKATAPATVQPGVLPRLRQLINRIKNAPAYTEDIGDDLGITGTDEGNAADPNTAKPTAKVTVLPGSQVRIDFVKSGYDGVWIESRRKNEADWSFLAIDLHSPYLDARPPMQPGTPEQREYRLRFYDNDAPTGQWSDIIVVTTMP